MTSYRFAVLSAVLLAVCSTSCVESKHPLSDAAQARVDESVIGIWMKVTDGTTSILMIGRNRGDSLPEGTMRFAQSQIDEDGVVTSHDGRCFVTYLGGNRYLNTFGLPEEGGIENVEQYSFIKYRLNGNRLEIWYASPSGAGKAIRAGRLQGKTTYDPELELPDEFLSSELTSATDQLSQYLQNGGDAQLFPDHKREVFVRMPDLGKASGVGK